MDFNINRLRTGETVAAGSAIALFIFMFFFKWYGLKGHLGDLAGGYSTGVNGWHGLTIVRWILLLAIIVAVGAAFITATQRTVALPVAASVMTAAIGILASLLLVIRVIIDHPYPHSLVGNKAGAYLGLLSAIGIAVGGWLAMKDEGTTFAEAGSALDRSMGSAGRGTTRPAPAPTASPAAGAPPAPTPPPAVDPERPTAPPPPGTGGGPPSSV